MPKKSDVCPESRKPKPTCELNGVNPFDYLDELQRRTDAVAGDPAVWLPWNYRQQVVSAVASR